MANQLQAMRPSVFAELVQPSSARDIPAIVAEAGNAARFAWEEFFFGRIRSPHTRRACHRAVKGFLDRYDKRKIKLADISPADVGHYRDSLPLATSSKKQVLAGLRHFISLMDW